MAWAAPRVCGHTGLVSCFLAFVAFPLPPAPYLGESPRPDSDSTVVEQSLHCMFWALGQSQGWTLQGIVQGCVSPIVHGVDTDTTGQEQFHDGRIAAETGQMQGPPPVLVSSVGVGTS